MAYASRKLRPITEFLHRFVPNFGGNKGRSTDSVIKVDVLNGKTHSPGRSEADLAVGSRTWITSGNRLGLVLVQR